MTLVPLHSSVQVLPGWRESFQWMGVNHFCQLHVQGNLDSFRVTPVDSKRLMTRSRFCKWFCLSDPVTNTSMYTITLGRSCSKLSIERWNMAGVEAILKGRRWY